MINIGLLLTIISFFVSCSSYVKQIHKQIQREENAGKQTPITSRARRQSAMMPYRQYPYPGPYSRRSDRRPIQNPITLGRNIDSSNTQNYIPPGGSYGAKRRVRAKDLKDNSNEGSLWSSKNSESFLFVTNNVKKEGDIVILKVLAGLKETIQEELKRTIPPKKKTKKDDKSDKEVTKSSDSNANSSSSENSDPNEVYDKISTQVLQDFNEDYLFIKGSKEVLFQDSKRVIQVQGLIPKKNIDDDDSISSNFMLRPKVSILRY